MKRGILVYNPTAGQRDLRRAMRALIDRMRGRGLELVNAPTSGPGDATEIVRTFLDKGIDLVAVCGGDGTISESAAGVAGSSVTLGVLPGGTSNVLAGELGSRSLPTMRALLGECPRSGARARGERRSSWAGAGHRRPVMGKRTDSQVLVRAPGDSIKAGSSLPYEFPPRGRDRRSPPRRHVRGGQTRRNYGGDWTSPEAGPKRRPRRLLFAHRPLEALPALPGDEARPSGTSNNGLARVVRGRIRSASWRVFRGRQLDGDCVLHDAIR